MCIIGCINYPNTIFAVVLINVPIPLAARSAATRLLSLRVRIPPGTWMSLGSVACCQVEVTAPGRSLVQRNLPSVACLIVCDLRTLTKRRPRSS